LCREDEPPPAQPAWQGEVAKGRDGLEGESGWRPLDARRST